MRTVVARELMKNKDGGNPEINNKIVPMYWGNEITIFQDGVAYFRTNLMIKF